MDKNKELKLSKEHINNLETKYGIYDTNQYKLFRNPKDLVKYLFIGL